MTHRGALAAAASLGAAAAFVLVARRRVPGPHLTLANTLTLTRCAAAAGLAAQAAGRERRAGVWIGLVAACTVVDWLDGPVARWEGPTRFGAILDIEADSWLTLWAAVAAWRSGALPGWSVAPAIARYPVRIFRAAHRPMGWRPWQRAAGTMQMAVLCGALSPWRTLRRAAARLALPATILQLAAVAADALSES